MPAVALLEPDHQNLRARVTVTRTDERDARQRQVFARIDKGETSTLVWGDAVTLDVAPGPHVLKVNNTLVWKSLEFTAASGEHVEFQLVNAPGKLTLGFLVLLGVAPLYLTIERRSKRS